MIMMIFDYDVCSSEAERAIIDVYFGDVSMRIKPCPVMKTTIHSLWYDIEERVLCAHMFHMSIA
jgi:hypothetical protein